MNALSHILYVSYIKCRDILTEFDQAIRYYSLHIKFCLKIFKTEFGGQIKNISML